ncbi:poly [ADP-ribose] polymerase 14-like isoform X2 [Mizuhopecten yessoensis]|uniref:poly [ADP-ribose] polymerase 14-like isoform X2 n=1 Tax=Mizuhopecten yessoensis TaxID=6573 RepID=UPI000B45EA16|nr:poly [ADP-ribose] polymerase 14-like isoform X2 [Mizuhopecten yessoensis]
MESNSDNDQGDASPSQQKESKPGGNTEGRSMSIMSQIAKRQATQQAGSDEQQDTFLSGWSSAIRGNIHDFQENIGDWREVHGESLIEEKENLYPTGDIYVIPPLSGTGHIQRQEGDSTRISSLEDGPHVGSTDVILKIDNQTLDVGNKSDGNINELASTETQDLELQTVTQLDDNRESETVPVVAKSTSDAKKDSSKDQTVYDIEGRTDVKTEETGRSQRKPPEVHPKQFKLQSEPFKFIVDGSLIQDQSRSEERAIPKKPHVDSQTSTDKSSSGVLHENRKSFKDILHQFEKPKPKTVSTSQPHPEKLVDQLNQLTPSQRTEFSDSHISVSSDASGGLGSDMVGNLIRTNIMSDSTASNISSIVPGIDQSLSHPTLQPGSQLVEQPEPSMGVGEQKGEEPSISSFTSLTEGLSQQIQQQGNTNVGLEGIQLTRDQGPFQGQFMHAESPPHDQQIHPEEPVRSQPVHAGPYQGQAKQEEFYHQPVQGEQLQGQPNNQYLGHPSQPYQFQGQQYHQQEQPQYPWQLMGRENWPDCQVFPGQLGNIPPHDPQYHGMYGQPGMYQPHTVGQEYYPHGHWRDGQNPQDSHPQNTNPAGPQKPNVHKVKEEPSAKQPRKTKPASKEKKEQQTPKKPEKSYVCVKGLNANTGLDTLWLYLENKSGCDVDKSSVLYTSDKTMAVATLLGSPANFQEFKNKCHQKKLEGASVRVCVVPAPVTVVVSSEQHMPSEHEMKKHFQQDKFGWVKVRRIKMTDDGCYRVQFKDNAAFEKVCHSPYPHKIGSASLCVTALYECEFGEVWEDDKHKVCIPDNIVLKHADHHKMELVKKYETIKELLQSKLKPKLAKLKVTDELHVECTMDQKTEGVRRLVRVWDSEVREIWEEFIDVTVQQDEILVTAEVWKDLFGHVKEHTAHKTVHLDFQDHDSDVRLVVVGIETMFSTVTENLYQHKDCIEKAIERKKQIRSVTKEFKSFEIRLLRRLDTLTQVNTLVEDLNVTDNEELGTITYNGVIEDINTAQTIIGDITQQFRIWTIQEDNAMNNDQVRLLQNRQVQNQLKQKFAEHKLVVELDCTAGGLELGTVSASAEQDVTRIINDTVTFSDVPLTDTEKIEVLKTFPWKQQCQQIQEDNSGLVIVSTMMDYGFKVTSTDIIHKDILKQLRTFIGEHAKYEDRYDINDEGRIKFFKKHYSREIKTIKTDLSAMSVSIMMEDKGLALAGTWQGIHQAKDRLNTLEKDIKSKQHDIHRLGIGTIVRPDNADMFCGIENETTTIIMQHETFIQLAGSQGSSDEEEEDLCGTEESNTWGRTGMFGAVPAPQPSPVTLPTRVPAEVTCKNGLKIKLLRGEIGREKADVLVISTSQDLELDKAGAGKSLVKYGGPGLQAELKANHPSKINHGDIITIGPGTLKCKQVFLCNLPEWEKDKNKKPMVVTEVIVECLTKAAKAGYSTVKFVALGTGALKYPPQIVAESMYGAVHRYDAKGTSSVLLVTFVLYSSDRRTISSFEKEEQMRLSPSRAYTSGPHQCFYTKGNRLRVSIDTCSIADFQKADVIAATVSDDLDLSKGGAMAAISKKGGITLKAECDIKYPRGIKIGDLAEISPGSLSCKALYLGTLPSHSSGPAAAEKALDKYIQKVLDTASSKGYTSVAFPAVGTGFNNYPHSRAATLCYEAVQHFDKKPSSIKTVYFVILQKDAQSLNAFQREERKRNRLPFGGPSPGSELGAVGGVARRGTFRRVFSKKDEEVSLRPRRRPTRTNELGFLGRRSDKLGSYQDHPVTLASGAGCMSIQGGKTNQFVYGKVTLQVNVENIVKLKDRVEVIVNSTNKDLDFTKGAVSKEIVKMCDPKQLSDECEKLKPEMKRKGMIYTSGCGLSCTAILHIDAQSSLRSWKNTILACLQEADRHGHTSIAFPALGTAGESVQFKPEEIAETLHESLQQFSGSKLTLVRLVIFEQKMLWGMQKVFRDNIQKPSTSVAEDYNVVPGSRATPVADVSRVSLWILGTSDYNIDDAIASIKNLVDRKYTVKTNADTLVCQLKDYEVKEIEKLSKRFLVEIKVNKQARVVEMDGPLEEVNNVSQEVHRLFSHFQMERHKDAEAEFIKEQVQWFYTEIDSQGVLQLSEYPPRTNMELENSRKGNHPTYKFRANDQEYVVNLLTMKEYAKDDPTDTADVVRREKQEGGRFELPADWNEMVDPKEIVRVIPLAASSKTYQDTETLFKNSVLKGFYSSQFPATKLIVHKIERVQNRSLFQQYSMKKSLLEQKNPPGTTNEQLLWHGTGTAAITSINYYGFNRSYCGGDLKKGACWYGAGVYFADDASYSARDWLSGSGPANQKRNVYLCKVLTGVSCPAAKNMKYLPALPNNPGQNYDSAVQPQNKLKEYIIFNDTQAYPEFLINFSAT